MKKIITIFALLCALISARAQYMSFFGDSTWRYLVTYITQPPEDYLNYPPEEPNLLGVYCKTLSYSFRKDSLYGSFYVAVPFQGTEFHWDWENSSALKEDTVYGRLYNGQYLICDMSLSEGDTFVLKGMCDRFYDGAYYPDHDDVYREWQWVETDTISFTMKVDSVRYVLDRKIIHLSLLDNQEDYFFGTGNGNLLSDYRLSIRFIEGIGPTYGLLSDCMYAQDTIDYYPIPGYHVYAYDWIINLHPWLGLMQCMYKDDSLVYMAHESLGCNQTCVGITDFADISMNLYPNPATQYVVLDMSTGEEMNGLVTITDMLGRVCHQQKAEGTSVRISVSDLPAGMYILSYTDGKRNITKKILKK